MAAVIQFAVESEERNVVRLGEKTLSVGRCDECDIQLSDRTVHRRHAEIFEYNGQYWIRAVFGEDLQVNGEWVNSHPLRHRDRVRCGKVTLEFLVEE